MLTVHCLVFFWDVKRSPVIDTEIVPWGVKENPNFRWHFDVTADLILLKKGVNNNVEVDLPPRDPPKTPKEDVTEGTKDQDPWVTGPRQKIVKSHICNCHKKRANLGRLRGLENWTEPMSVVVSTRVKTVFVNDDFTSKT